jgi:hypothetical protein
MGLRYASKVDRNQAAIVRELRGLGFQVDLVHRLKGLYDLVVTGRMGSGAIRTLRVEVKMPGEDLSPDEKEYWAANMFPETLIIAHDTEQVMEWFGRI